MQQESTSDDVLAAIAADVGKDWRHASDYYDPAEAEMDQRWTYLVSPMLAGCNFEVCVDLAAGHGRNTVKLLQQPGSRRCYIVDINEENIDFCTKRFAAEPRVSCHLTRGFELAGVPDGEVTLLYCFDAMVHFDSDLVRRYLAEARRVLVDGGRCFFHHSNYSGNPGGDVHDNPQWRNFMTAPLIAHYAAKEGLQTLRQQPMDWGHDGTFIDCFSVFAKPG